MKNYIREFEIQPTNTFELAMVIKIYQSNLTKEKCQKYVNRLKKVIDIVIERHGGWSDC